MLLQAVCGCVSPQEPHDEVLVQTLYRTIRQKMPHNDPPCTCILRSHVAFDSSRLPNTLLYPRPYTQHSDARQHKHNPLTTATQPDCCNSYLKQLPHQILLTMDETATSTIRVDELVAISAIHGDALSDVRQGACFVWSYHVKPLQKYKVTLFTAGDALLPPSCSTDYCW